MTDPFEILQQIADETGGTLQRYPRPRNPVRRLTLRDVVDGENSQFEEAVLDEDGTVFVIGADRGPKVTDFFGEGISSYDWVFVIAPEHVPDLVDIAGGTGSEDVLALVAALYARRNGRMHGPLTAPPVSAKFDNWHS